MKDSTTSIGWRCSYCGEWVLPNTSHCCVTSTPKTSGDVYYYTFTPVWERIANALERIAKALENK